MPQQLYPNQEYFGQEQVQYAKYDLPFSPPREPIHHLPLQQEQFQSSGNPNQQTSKFQQQSDKQPISPKLQFPSSGTGDPLTLGLSPSSPTYSFPKHEGSGEALSRLQQKLGTLDSILKNRNLQTLEPLERIDMFMSKRRLTFLLQILYQWRSVAKMRLNQTPGNRTSVSPLRTSASPYRQSQDRPSREYFTFNENRNR